jgi:hypothetical protein
MASLNVFERLVHGISLFIISKLNVTSLITGFKPQQWLTVIYGAIIPFVSTNQALQFETSKTRIGKVDAEGIAHW